jgi:hypothetical protein
MLDAAAIKLLIGQADAAVHVEGVVSGEDGEISWQIYLFGTKSSLNGIAKIGALQLLHGVHDQPVQQFLLLPLQAALMLRRCLDGLAELRLL